MMFGKGVSYHLSRFPFRPNGFGRIGPEMPLHIIRVNPSQVAPVLLHPFGAEILKAGAQESSHVNLPGGPGRVGICLRGGENSRHTPGECGYLG